MDQPTRPEDSADPGDVRPRDDSGRSQWREFTGALAAAIPADAIPNEPLTPEAVRNLAADLAADLLFQLTQVGDEAESEVQGLALSQRKTSFNCTGASFICNEMYACNDVLHSCTKAYSCPSIFGCSGGPFTGFSLRR